MSLRGEGERESVCVGRKDRTDGDRRVQGWEGVCEGCEPGGKVPRSMYKNFYRKKVCASEILNILLCSSW